MTLTLEYASHSAGTSGKSLSCPPTREAEQAAEGVNSVPECAALSGTSANLEVCGTSRSSMLDCTFTLSGAGGLYVWPIAACSRIHAASHVLSRIVP